LLRCDRRIRPRPQKYNIYFYGRITLFSRQKRAAFSLYSFFSAQSMSPRGNYDISVPSPLALFVTTASFCGATLSYLMLLLLSLTPAHAVTQPAVSDTIFSQLPTVIYQVVTTIGFSHGEAASDWRSAGYVSLNISPSDVFPLGHSPTWIIFLPT